MIINLAYLEIQIKDQINEFCISHYEQGHRKHLGASELGEECWRKLWYGFRWVKEDKHDGRILRLFNVGHQAEQRFISYLRGIGFEVQEHNENGTQIKIAGCNGHYGGSLDGMCKPPANYELNGETFLLEFKTNGTGKGFSDVENGLQKAKPKHYAQMCQYGYKMGIKYGIYLIENKNDSDIIVKVVELDWNLGAQLEKKANDIIFAKEPPPRISENPAMYSCKYCNFSDICHKGSKPEKNCRSCKNSEPVENGEWQCNKFGLIPEDFIPLGCSDWLSI
jgi:hypothetical protein